MKRHLVSRDQAFHDLVDIIVVTIRAGHDISEALAISQRLLPSDIATHIHAVTHRLDMGEPLSDVLPQLSVIFGAQAIPLVDILRSAALDGLPVISVVERLSDEARSQRSRRLDTEIRRLPVRLTFPLVFCTLPSFILLSIIPLVGRAVSSLHVNSPPSTIITTKGN